MMSNHGILDPEKRQQDKERRRREDEERLRSGRVSPAELDVANGFFSSLDMGEFQIEAIGRRELDAIRSRKA